jgi:YHS domain-containing protein
MYRHVVVSRVWCVVVLAILARRADAQSPAEIVTLELSGAPAALGQQMQMPPIGQMPMPREASGTAWLPDNSPMYALHWQRGPWEIMFHENAFLQSLHESGDRGASQTGSINWVMGMAQRSAGPGRMQFRAMVSGEPWTIGGCGYPDLLASGEVCKGEQIHDRQHPHDLFMELAAAYDAPLKGQIRWQLYGGPVGEPALGPVAYPHRLSAMPNPIAPVSHHWFDSTHVSFGVVTAGVYGDRWKAEGSVFNGREPDENRKDFDFGSLNSFSGRFWFLPAANVALQVSAGRLNEAEAAEGNGPRTNVDRVTATASVHRVRERSVWATTAGWGRNSELGIATNAFLVETSFTFADRDAWFGRFEASRKTAHDLDVANLSDDLLTVSKLQGGYTRYVSVGRFKAGLGVEGSLGFVSEALKALYGRRANPGGGIFLTIRPAMMPVASSGGGGGMIMVQTALDPSKLSCSPQFDPSTAPSTSYEGKTYYFCSEADRDEFLKDPRMSLGMMPPKP